jgi:serine/threonine protein kinase
MLSLSPKPQAEPSLRSGVRMGHDEPETSDAEWVQSQVGASVGCSHRITRYLASGGMGHVFLSEHVHLGALAAAKVPRVATAQARSMIESEGRLLSKLQHPNIVKAMDIGQMADGRPYLLLEYAQGVELDAWLDGHGAMGAERALPVLAQLASAVDYLHKVRIVHGDIKPANIMLDVSNADFVKLIDFGIASSEARRGQIGTPAYMAPEQAAGDEWGTASDIYAVAAVAMELLTGRPPHEHHATAQAALTALLTKSPASPSARGLRIAGLDAVFERALHGDPRHRYPTASAFVSELKRVFAADAALPSPERSERSAPGTLTAAGAPPVPWSLLLSHGAVLRRLAAGLVAAVYLFAMYD